MNENNQKINPFVRLDNCGAIINDIDYDSTGRLTYMPYSGVNDTEGKNKVISTPDACSAALSYTVWCNDIMHKQLSYMPKELTVEFAKAAISNVDFIINNRLRFEIGTAILTVFNANTRAIILPYIINPDWELDNYNLFMRTAQSLYIDRIFDKDNLSNGSGDFPYNNNRVKKDDNELNRYCVDQNEIMVKATKIVSFLSADIANIYSRYIYNTLPVMDIRRFANESIESLGIDRSLVSTDNDLPYTSSILNEAAYNDVRKITEIVELLVNHSYYVFMNLYTNIISKIPKQMLVDKSSNQQPVIDSIPYTNPKGVTNNIMYTEYINK